MKCTNLISLLAASIIAQGCAELDAMIRESEARKEREAQASAQATQEGIRSRCQAYGFSPGTDAFASCVQREYAQRRQAAIQVLQQLQSQQRNVCKNSWGREVSCSELERERTYQTDCYGNPNSYSCTTRRQ